MNYGLPTALDVNGTSYPIRSDWRAALDVISALNDPNLTDVDKAVVVLGIIYVEQPKDADEALKQAMWFISGGSDEKPKKTRKKLMDWEQDFPFIIVAVNNVAGKELRSEKYCHWWTFLGYYQSIGDSAFTQIVSIRKKKQSGKKLEQYEKDFYRENREAIDFKTKYTDEELEVIKSLVR